MNASEAKSHITRRLLATTSVAILLATAACAPQAAAPTAAPAKPAPTAAPAQPPPATAAPKVEAPTAKPAPTAAPAAKPTEKPAAKAVEYDEKAVADFYKGKTIRMVVGMAPGGSSDTAARLLQTVWSKYIPGNPTVVVENKPGAGGILAANTVYNSEPKDGTVVAAPSDIGALRQALGDKGVQFDGTKYQWLGSTYGAPGACAARVDSGITTLQELIASGKEFTVSSYGKGGSSWDPPAIVNAALGTKFKIITGYESGATQLLAVKNKEVQGWCSSFEGLMNVGGALLEGADPVAKVLFVLGSETPNHPVLKGVPAAETLAKTDEAKAMLRAVHAGYGVLLPHALPPEVPKDRVQALRRARDKAFADPQFVEAAQKAKMTVSPKTGEEVSRIVQDILSAPPALVAKLKQALD